MLPELYQNALTGRPSLRYSRVHRWRPRCGLHILQLEDRPAQKEAPCIVSEGSDNFDICNTYLMIKFQVKEQLNAIEERRLEDMERTERKNADAQKKLEQILNRHVALMS